MAVIMNDAAYMGFPLSIKRGNPAPVDTTAVWYSKTELEAYAKTGATAYVGQILTLVADNKCEAFMISNEAGTLIKLAQTTASGDLAHDVATLQGQVADLISKVGAEAGTDTEATGLYKEIADVLAVANGKVSSVKATDASVVISGTTTAPTVGVQLSKGEGNALTLEADGLKVLVPDVTHPEYSIVADKNPGSFSAVYHLTKNGTNVGAAINIPKDMVVQSGTVQTFEAGALPEGVATAGTYIVLTLANATSTKLYIKVDDLIEYVTGGSGENDAIQINVTSDTHKVSASVKDGSLTLAMLSSAVQASLKKADSAVQSIAEGATNGTISVDGADVAVHGLQDGAYATVKSLNDTAQGYATAVKTELVGTDSDEATASTIAGAKKYADSVSTTAKTEAIADAQAKIEALDVPDKAVAKKFVSAVSETDGKITVSRRELVADDVPTLGISKIDGLQTALDAKQNELVFNTAYDSSTNKVATMTDVGNAKDALVGTDADTKASNTIKGAKLYADDKASSALTDAKAYADGLVAGDSGITKRVDALEAKVDTTGKVSEAIATAKTEAVTTAGTNADTKISTAKTEILGEEGYQQTVKSAYELAGAKTTLAEAVAEIEKKDYATKTEAQGYADAKDTAIAAAKKAGTDAQSAVDALSKKVGSIPESSKATTVVGYVDEKIGAIPAQTDYTVTVTPSTVEGLAKRYTVHQEATGLDVNIDIPTDMVVKSGAVVTNPAGQTAGTYLVLTLANATNDKVYIDVGNLIEYVTSGSGATDMVKIAVSADHKVTASITDGSITKAKLTTAVQGSLDKADSAIQQAGLTTALEPYAKTADVAKGYVAKETGKRLMTDAEGTKLEGIETGAQVNKIESIKVGGTALKITEKAVNISQISTDLLINGTETLILNCGNANA
nr:MAG TPA: hypothetical protein [Caudoviricetes sp.]